MTWDDPDNGQCERCGLPFDGYQMHHECECRTCEEPGCDVLVTVQEADQRDAVVCEEHLAQWIEADQ